MDSGNSIAYMEGDIDTKIASLGNARIDSPMRDTTFIEDSERTLINSLFAFLEKCRLQGRYPSTLEIAGPRKKIFFDPSKTKAGIVTCGGLCPGINNVIRSIVMEFYYMYGVHNICGIPYGLQGFIPSYAHPIIDLTPEAVEHIQERGGTVLGSSRGGQDVTEIVDAIERLNLNILFFIGGDGTLKCLQGIINVRS
jgi:6-phosphofructokinase 1